jgi:hypothetical protein
VLGFFQNANSWGVDFVNTLEKLGTSNVAGALTLALNANLATESSPAPTRFCRPSLRI